MNKIWVCVESVNPHRWAIRVGNHWAIARKIKISIPMVTKTQSGSPRLYMYGEGYVFWKGNTVDIFGERGKKIRQSLERKRLSKYENWGGPYGGLCTQIGPSIFSRRGAKQKEKT